MTADQRQKIQHAIQALIDVESALHSATAEITELEGIQERLHAARLSLVELNGPDYN